MVPGDFTDYHYLQPGFDHFDYESQGMDIHHPVTRSIYEQPQEPMIRTPAPTIA